VNMSKSISLTFTSYAAEHTGSHHTHHNLSYTPHISQLILHTTHITTYPTHHTHHNLSYTPHKSQLIVCTTHITTYRMQRTTHRRLLKRLSRLLKHHLHPHLTDSFSRFIEFANSKQELSATDDPHVPPTHLSHPTHIPTPRRCPASLSCSALLGFVCVGWVKGGWEG